MDDAALVRVLECLRDLDEHRHDRQVAGAAQPAQVPARGELHRQDEGRAVALRREHLEDARVIQAARTLVLVHERDPGCGGAAPGPRAQDLQRNVGAGLGVEGAPDLPLPAGAEPLPAGRTGPSGAAGLAAAGSFMTVMCIRAASGRYRRPVSPAPACRFPVRQAFGLRSPGGALSAR